MGLNVTPRWITRLVRRHVASAYLYGLLRSIMLAGQWGIRRPDEPDLLFIGRIPQCDGELILDIGANGGQSAVALGFIRPQARIVSYEPVRTLWPELARVKILLGRRFEFRRYGLGNAAGTFTLHVPVCGELPMTTRASISEDAAKRSCLDLERTVGLPTRIETMAVEVRKGDDEDLRPIAIKIDVEGAEHEVLQGLAVTIQKCRPLVLLEKSESFESCALFFEGLGYDILTAKAESGREMSLAGLSTRNWIACPPELTPTILAQAAGEAG